MKVKTYLLKIQGCALFLAAVVFCTVCSFVWADSPYPNREISVLVGFKAGGAADLVARPLAEAMGKHLGKSVVVINKAGGGGLLALTDIVRAVPDGYKLMLSTATPLTAKHITKDAPSLDQLQVIAMINIDPSVVLVHKESPYKSLKDLFNDAKVRPRVISLGHTGVGGSLHLNALAWQVISGARFKFVPYSGDSESLPALAGGHIDVVSTTYPPARQLIKAGKIRALGVSSENRDPDFPDVPTFKEQGYNWVGGAYKFLVAPKGLPVDILKKLEESVEIAMKNEKLETFWKTSGFDKFYLKREQALQFLNAEEKIVAEAFKIN